jgi:diacylglycerol kinase (ATP)
MAEDSQLPKEGGTGMAHLLRAFGYSMTGLRTTFLHESAFRQELLLCAVAMPLGMWLGESAVERVLLVGSLLLVLALELMNTAIENAIDRISPERHELAKRSKDAGSASVFVGLVLAGFVWLQIVILPRLAALAH